MNFTKSGYIHGSVLFTWKLSFTTVDRSKGWELVISMISKVLNAYRMSSPLTSNPEPGKNRWFSKGSESETLLKSHRSDLKSLVCHLSPFRKQQQVWRPNGIPLVVPWNSHRLLTHFCDLVSHLSIYSILFSLYSYFCYAVCLVAQSCPTLCDPVDCSSFVHGDSPGKNTGVGCHALLQEIFPAQGRNPGLPHCRWILYCLSHQGGPFAISP